VAGLATSFGSGAMTNSIAEIEDADAILVIGSNTTENHPVISNLVKRATLKDAKLIVADPRKITLTKFADVWLRQRPGTDVALVNGLIHVILEEGLQDQTFISERTEKFDVLKQSVSGYTVIYRGPGDKKNKPPPGPMLRLKKRLFCMPWGSPSILPGQIT